MSAYSTRQLAALLDLPPKRIRALARAALLEPARDSRGHLLFSFQDLVLLRTAKALLNAHGSARRIRRAMRNLGLQLGEGKPLCSVRMHLQGSDLLATAGNTTWAPESGQTLFDFSHRREKGSVEPIATPAASAAESSEPSAEEWFELGLALEQSGAVSDAEAAYRRAFAVDPAHVDSRINLGRLRHQARALEEAAGLYRQALALDPSHAIAHFNLGVVLEDGGEIEAAIETYQCAAALDPKLGEAHYNLARLFELRGDERSALRHLASFKRIKDA